MEDPWDIAKQVMQVMWLTIAAVIILGLIFKT